MFLNQPFDRTVGRASHTLFMHKFDHLEFPRSAAYDNYISSNTLLFYRFYSAMQSALCAERVHDKLLVYRVS